MNEQETGQESVGQSDVRHELWTTVHRGDKEMEFHVGGGSFFSRIKGNLSILAWNRWAAKDSKQKGVAFPEDAPKHFWQVNWISVWKG